MSNQPIPFLDLVTPHRELEDELVEAFRQAVRSAAFVGGPEVEAFEREFAAYCGAKYCVGVANGTDALRFALMGAGVGRGDAVLTVAHTFIATVEAISQAGAGTEFVDVDERTYTMSPHALEEYLRGCAKDPLSGRPLGKRTGLPIKAVLPVHLYGQAAEMDAIQVTAARYGLLVVEDAAQAQGTQYFSRLGAGQGSSAGTWRRAGTFGKAAGFSFYPGKNLGSCGEGGAVTTDDERVAKTVKMLREHGQTQKYYHDLEGYNGRLHAIQAAFLRIKLRHLDDWNAGRRAAASRYEELLSHIPGIAVPFEPETSRAIYHLYVIRTPDREGLADHLTSSGVSTGLHYPVPVHLQKCYCEWGYAPGSLPVTERVAAEILSLPMFPTLTARQQGRVAAAIGEFALNRAASATIGTLAS